MSTPNGLGWVDGVFGPEPIWTMEPDIKKIEKLARKHLQVSQDTPCQVTTFAQGTFNKLFKIETKAGETIMRVSLPVDPTNKTNSGIATIAFVRQYTTIPVPQVFAFDDSRENELGFEWILMDFIAGKTLDRAWRKLTDEAKTNLVKQVAKYQAQLFGHKFSVIGNLFTNLKAVDTAPANAQQTPHISQQPVLGPVVSNVFFWGIRADRVVSRGPFDTPKNWLLTRLDLILADQEDIIEASTNDEEAEDAINSKELITRLLKLLPTVFPNGAKQLETALFHDDLSMHNILVDAKGNINGIVDWECVSAVPLWKAYELPKFLQGSDRVEKPSRDDYGKDTGDYFADGMDLSDLLDNEGVNPLYWDNLMEYELTQLRETFKEDMAILAPGWTETPDVDGGLCGDFELAVQNCNNGYCNRLVHEWIDAVEKGEVHSLRKAFQE